MSLRRVSLRRVSRPVWGVLSMVVVLAATLLIPPVLIPPVLIPPVLITPAGAGTEPSSPPPTSAPVPDPAPEPGGVPSATSPADPGPTTTVDPLLDEAPGESAPPVEATVPPRKGSYGDQKYYEPPGVLWSSVGRAEDKLAGARWTYQELVAQARTARAAHKGLVRHQQALDTRSRQATDDLRAAEKLLQERAVAAFVSNDRATNAVIGSLDAADHDKVLDLQVRHRLLGVALDADEAAIADYVELRGDLARELVDIVDQIRAAGASVLATENEAEAAADAVRQAEAELAAFRAGSAIYISGVVFPVAQPYNRPLIDSFGFPRMPGTPDEHWHEGIDIFAPAGTPLLAAERGVITRVGSSRLGGLTVWLRGESGADWYYAHLQAHAPGLAPGAVVEPGAVVGYVGNTGNAVSTPPHLHLQLHPAGGDPVNPYPLLKVISDQDGVEGSR